MKNNKLGLIGKIMFLGTTIVPFVGGCGRERLQEPISLYEKSEERTPVKKVNKTPEKKKPQNEFARAIQRTLDYQRSFFTGNAILGDKDESGFIEDNEIEGFGKRKFYSDENIVFGFRCSYDGTIGKNLNFELRNERGEILASKNEIIRDESDLKTYTFLPGQLSNGRYTVIWYCEGATHIGSKEKAEIKKEIIIAERGIEARGKEIKVEKE